ncbi:coniferyl-aldehyde dehydrogenase [Endozoicomonas sp. OPT23]|uniref:coniferyl aldehyde dehydrogenase n=1 Tax=Endozoicomonas sp. OPT23 TaxID=2072845 RepID=UPI00129A49AE|nr:coniferyl aldehyde dehydrogenase [Endozoicomonas sp. OPT23]MRI32528.1 coniferyl-aldehyde dehydrogenase [Endozoicomonas sp. OPT23]
MNDAVTTIEPASIEPENLVRTTDMEVVLKNQKKAFLHTPYPSVEQRREWLATLKKALQDNQAALVEAINQDFEGRAREETLLAEFMPSLNYIDYCSKKLGKWTKFSKRRVPLTMQPVSAKVIYQPLGVVGIVVPWNYPVFLAVGPLATALAAGNRAMVKMSEFTPTTSELLAKIIADIFPDNLVTVINGEAEVGAQFTALPFDHILFTGSTQVGRHVMNAAARNLTPVTLELGGKSPVIVDSDFPMSEVAERVCYGKSLNAGQTCVAPDYILVKKERQQEFIDAYLKAFSTMYPKVSDNPHYTAIINKRQHDRLLGHIEDARAKGADIVIPENEQVSDGSRRLPPHLILNPTDDMTVMHEEIFGPLLPIIGVDSIDQAIDYVNSRPRPLALYYFGGDKQVQEKVLTETHSGGVCLNETLFQVAIDDLPFGGIGPSGMGHYHGHEGFLTLSKAKAVVSKGKFNSVRMLFPPYDTSFKQSMIKYLSGSN